MVFLLKLLKHSGELCPVSRLSALRREAQGGGEEAELCCSSLTPPVSQPRRRVHAPHIEVRGKCSLESELPSLPSPQPRVPWVKDRGPYRLYPYRGAQGWLVWEVGGEGGAPWPTAQALNWIDTDQFRHLLAVWPGHGFTSKPLFLHLQ